MARMIADCRRFESENHCTMTFIGGEDEVVATAVAHAVSTHGHTDSPELREQVRALLEPEDSYIAGERQPDALPA